MSYNKIWKLTFNGFEVPIYVVNASFEATRPNPITVSVTAAYDPAELDKFKAKQSLIDFAKTGAPPKPLRGHSAFASSLDRLEVDGKVVKDRDAPVTTNTPRPGETAEQTYARTREARDAAAFNLAAERLVPRFFDQKPWVDPLKVPFMSWMAADTLKTESLRRFVSVKTVMGDEAPGLTFPQREALKAFRNASPSMHEREVQRTLTAGEKAKREQADNIASRKLLRGDPRLRLMALHLREHAKKSALLFAFASPTEQKIMAQALDFAATRQDEVLNSEVLTQHFYNAVMRAKEGNPVGEETRVVDLIGAVKHIARKWKAQLDRNVVLKREYDQLASETAKAIKPTRPASLNDFAAECHRDNQHWWHDPATGEKLYRNMGEMLMLVVSEIAECMEGERKDLMDTHLPHRKMAEVELADAIIRIADIAGAKRIDLNHQYASDTNDIPLNKGQALLRIVKCVQEASAPTSHRLVQLKISRAFLLIELYAKKHGYDLWGAVVEKRAYNKTRADHKPEARLAAGGKKF